jgi:hypothetical protein
MKAILLLSSGCNGPILRYRYTGTFALQGLHYDQRKATALTLTFIIRTITARVRHAVVPGRSQTNSIESYVQVNISQNRILGTIPLS